MIFRCKPGKKLDADSQLTAIFSLVVEEQVKAGRGFLRPIDTQLLNVNCNEKLDFSGSTASDLLWKTAWVDDSEQPQR